MIVLTIRTDKPDAEAGLFNSGTELSYKKWHAHRELSENLHKTIKALLKKHNIEWDDLSGIVCFKGPGSFTGLRIGLTVGNALAATLEVPIVSATGEGWIQQGIRRLQHGENEVAAMPEYGTEAHITKPKK